MNYMIIIQQWDKDEPSTGVEQDSFITIEEAKTSFEAIDKSTRTASLLVDVGDGKAFQLYRHSELPINAKREAYFNSLLP